jgi:hypothetical protein
MVSLKSRAGSSVSRNGLPSPSRRVKCTASSVRPSDQIVIENQPQHPAKCLGMRGVNGLENRLAQPFFPLCREQESLDKIPPVGPQENLFVQVALFLLVKKHQIQSVWPCRQPHRDQPSGAGHARRNPRGLFPGRIQFRVL